LYPGNIRGAIAPVGKFETGGGVEYLPEFCLTVPNYKIRNIIDALRFPVSPPVGGIIISCSPKALGTYQ
jgi:hypothetical protein